jgi:hypothetical protein
MVLGIPHSKKASMNRATDFRFGQAEAVIQGLESLRCPAVLVGKALANFQATEWTKKNILQVDSAARPRWDSTVFGV